jgi:hypothetical protein
MEKMVARQRTRGLADPSIQEREILAHAAQTPDMDLDTTLKLVEAKETGKRSGNLIAAAGGGINRLGDRQCGAGGRKRSTSEPPDDGKCSWCNLSGHGRRASQETRRSKCKVFGAACKQCGKKDHFKIACRSTKKHPEGTNNSISTTTKEENIGTFCALKTTFKKGKITQTLPHHVYEDFRGWLARKPEAHPIVGVSVSLCTDGYTDLKLPQPRVSSRDSKQAALPDTGAMMVVAGVSLIHKLGITKKELIPLANGVSTADNAGLGMIGGVLITVSGQAEDGSIRRSNQLCYIAENIHCLFLSRQCCRDLGIIGENFPKIGSFSAPNSPDLSKLSSSEPPPNTEARPCKCPDRSHQHHQPNSPCQPQRKTEKNLKSGLRMNTPAQLLTAALIRNYL